MTGVATDNAGNVYLADQTANRIRKITTAGVISTFAGVGQAGFSGDGNQATTARLSGPSDLAVGPGGDLFIADTGNNRVRKVTPGGVISTVAGNGSAGDTGDGAGATSAAIGEVRSIVVDSTGRLSLATAFGDRVRRVDGGTITTIAGPGASDADGVDAHTANLSVQDLGLDGSGNVLISSLGRVRNVDGGGIITTVGGATAGPPRPTVRTRRRGHCPRAASPPMRAGTSTWASKRPVSCARSPRPRARSRRSPAPATHGRVVTAPPRPTRRWACPVASRPTKPVICSSTTCRPTGSARSRSPPA